MILVGQSIASGLVLGSIYALIALGFSLIYNVSGILNIAQGEFVVLGGMTAIWLTAMGVPVPVTFILAIAAGVVSGLLVERLLVIPRKKSTFPIWLCLTMAAGIAYKGLARIFWGVEPITLNSPVPGAFKLSEVVIPRQSLLIMSVILLLVVFLWFFLTRTLTGKALRAVRDTPEGASLVGIDPNGMVILSFAISAAVGALGGILIAPITMMSYAGGEFFLASGIAAAIVGGMGSVLGAFVGGYIIGLSEQLAAGLISPLFKSAIAMIIIIVVLAIKPLGLFGKPTVK
ncbi:MAG: branched-chain amino acid ABC transporter permease [Chloroflexi bacterium]|nr:branched-chain amino acid ABC transporter permease [Chloroflexota bacterium]